jgi:SNF2 family DNA or RNA helicase
VASPFVDVATLHGDADLGRYRLPGQGIEIRNQRNREILARGDEAQNVLLSLKVGEQFGPDRLDVPRRFVLTNYDTLANYQFSLCRIDWSFVIFDEAQHIKNPNTIQTRAAKGVKAQFKLMVTGTPVENQLTDFWCIFDTAVPGLLDSYQGFRKTYVLPLLKADETLPQTRYEIGKKLRSTVGALMLRRLKEDHLEGLPAKHVYVGVQDTLGTGEYLPAMECTMSGLQLDTYNSVIDATVQGMADEDGPGHFLQGLHRLRDVSLHPDLLGGMDLPTPATMQGCYAEMRKSEKLSAMLRVLDAIEERREKVLIFVINKRLQAFLSFVLGKIYGIPVAVINGDTKAVAKRQSALTRQRLIQQFEERDGFGIMVMSPVAAGVGLTITAANNVMHLERHWNPAREDQATDRVYRIGQTKDVYVYIPILHHPELDSFDLNLHRLLTKKIDLKDAVVTPEVVGPEMFQQTNIFGRTTEYSISPLSQSDLDHLGWEQFEALVAEMLRRVLGGEVQLTPVSNDKGCDVVFTSDRRNLLAQCKYTKHEVLQGDTFVREIYAAQKFYEDHFGKQLGEPAIFTNARKIGPQGRKAAASFGVTLYGRSWIVEHLRQHNITKSDLLRRLDKPRLSW